MGVRRAVCGLLGLSVLGIASCAHPEPRATVPMPDVELVSSELLHPAMLLQQRLRGEYQGKEFAFECVLQVSEGKLTIVGLTPFGSRAFVLTQQGTEHHFEKLVDRELPFDPVHILDDVQRVFFRALPDGARDGERVGVQGAERVRERWAAGVLVERSFQRLDGRPTGLIRVTYEGPNAPLVPARAVIENGWYGYRLAIESNVQQLLPR